MDPEECLQQRLGEPVTPEALGWSADRSLLYVPADDGLGQPWNASGTLAAATTINRLNSPRVQQLLGDFRRAAEPYANSTAVREFDVKHRDLIRKTSA